MRPNYTEFSGIQSGRDITRGWVEGYTGYLPTQDPILSLKSGGDLLLYEKVLEDYQVKSCLQQRFSKLTCKKVQVLPGGNAPADKKAATALLSQIEKLPWDAITSKMLMGVFYGFSCAEIIWEPSGDKVSIAAIKVRRRRRFKFGIDLKPLLITTQNPMGEPLPDRKFWHFSHGADNDDEPDGRGLAHWLYWLAWFKRNDIRWWISFLENFAEPSRIGKYPTGATDSEKKTLESAMQMLGRHKWATMPEGMLYELIEASRSGTADYQGMVDTLDAAISKIIVGQTMTTDSGSSRSQAEVHEGVGDAVTAEDNDLLSDSLQDLSRWWTDWNFPGAAPPIITRKMSEMDLSAEADKDIKLQGLGINLKPEAIVSKYGSDYIAPEIGRAPQLNGEQVNALVSIVSQAQAGGWKPELAGATIRGAFPNLTQATVSEITSNLGQGTPVLEPSPDLPVSQFAKMPEGSKQQILGKTYILKNSRWHLERDPKLDGSKSRPLDYPESEAEIDNANTPEHLWHLADKHQSMSNFFDSIEQSDRAVDHELLAGAAFGRAEALSKINPKAVFDPSKAATEIASAQSESHLDHLTNKLGRIEELLYDAIPNKSDKYGSLASAAEARRQQMRVERLDRENNYQVSGSESQFKVAIAKQSGTDERGTWSVEPHAWQYQQNPEDFAEWFASRPPVKIERVGKNGEKLPTQVLPGTRYSLEGATTDLIGALDPSSQSSIDDLIRYTRKQRNAQFAASPSTDAPDIIDEYVEQMRSQSPFDPWLQQAKQLLIDSDSLDDYASKLASLYPEMPSTDFNKLMIDAYTAASMAGYSEAQADARD
jgi:phage gp29-like protein